VTRDFCLKTLFHPAAKSSGSREFFSFYTGNEVSYSSSDSLSIRKMLDCLIPLQ